MIYLSFFIGCSIGKLKSEMLFVVIFHFCCVQNGLEHLGRLVCKMTRFYKCILILSLEILTNLIWALLSISVIINCL